MLPIKCLKFDFVLKIKKCFRRLCSMCLSFDWQWINGLWYITWSLKWIVSICVFNASVITDQLRCFALKCPCGLVDWISSQIEFVIAVRVFDLVLFLLKVHFLNGVFYRLTGSLTDIWQARAAVSSIMQWGVDLASCIVQLWCFKKRRFQDFIVLAELAITV